MRTGSSLAVVAFAAFAVAQVPDWTVREPAPVLPGDFIVLCAGLHPGQIVSTMPESFTSVSHLATYVWEGTDWRVASPPHSPPYRYQHAVVRDEARGRLVLFGGTGTNGAQLSDTWEWEGSDWVQSPASGPFGRSNHAMSFDASRGFVVLFGGNDGTRDRSDTWELNGSGWTQRFMAHAPSPRSHHVLVYDRARSRSVLCGGSNAQGGETWEWDGVDWTVRSGGGAPTITLLAYDEGHAQCVRLTATNNAVNTATLGSAGWQTRSSGSPITLAGTARPYTGGLMAYDDVRQRVVLLLSGTTWLWDGATWETCATAIPSLGARSLAYDERRGRVVLFSGQSPVSSQVTDVWEHDGARWHFGARSSSPAPRTGQALVYDVVQGQTVLFGGGITFTRLSDTWGWDGRSWQAASVSSAPEPRFRTCCAYDRARARVVLFGGQGVTSALDDTWEWDGSLWARQSPATSPSPRDSHVMAYDEQRACTVLFGANPAFALQDTWEWSQGGWTQRVTVGAPPSAYYQSMTYHPIRRRCVLVNPADTWEYDGINWRIVGTPHTTVPVIPSVTMDRQRGMVVMVDYLGGLWEYGVRGTAVAEPFGSGCGNPLLTATPTTGSRPVLGQVQSIALQNAPGGIAFMAYGWSNSSFGGSTLPLSLDALGMTGCELLQSADLLAQPCAITGPDAANHSVAIPNLPWLLGAHIWLQGWALAPGANAAGVIASNGVSLLFGTL